VYFDSKVFCTVTGAKHSADLMESNILSSGSSPEYNIVLKEALNLIDGLSAPH